MWTHTHSHTRTHTHTQHTKHTATVAPGLFCLYTMSHLPINRSLLTTPSAHARHWARACLHLTHLLLASLLVERGVSEVILLLTSTSCHHPTPSQRPRRAYTRDRQARASSPRASPTHTHTHTHTETCSLSTARQHRPSTEAACGQGFRGAGTGSTL